jgi:hypothetical protein
VKCARDLYRSSPPDDELRLFAETLVDGIHALWRHTDRYDGA